MPHPRSHSSSAHRGSTLPPHCLFCPHGTLLSSTSAIPPLQAPGPQSQVRTLLSRGRWSSGGPGCALRRGDSPQVTFLPPRVLTQSRPVLSTELGLSPTCPSSVCLPCPRTPLPSPTGQRETCGNRPGELPCAEPCCPSPHPAGHLALSRHRRLQFNTALGSIQAIGRTAEIGGGHRWWHPSRDFQQTPSGENGGGQQTGQGGHENPPVLSKGFIKRMT